MASPAVLGWHPNWQRQALHQDPDPFGDFFVWGLKRQSPEVGPSGLLASSKGSASMRRILPASIQKQNPEVSRASGFLFPPVGVWIRRTWPA